jgi:hypothetical protein
MDIGLERKLVGHPFKNILLHLRNLRLNGGFAAFPLTALLLLNQFVVK